MTLAIVPALIFSFNKAICSLLLIKFGYSESRIMFYASYRKLNSWKVISESCGAKLRNFISGQLTLFSVLSEATFLFQCIKSQSFIKKLISINLKLSSAIVYININILKGKKKYNPSWIATKFYSVLLAMWPYGSRWRTML